ncbi:hypothetical protein FISHEDRAFT_48249 [Fistulina hepatica ATCC 64428]|uniref:HNH nuclease domain-containing protein n=1 Tax=Fistulina hepatica ATCC 64428 TaxID=1128425 RepID=A0A0D7A5E1_9AGAR|nr:hypothetical protein FISHEDRAFT_48249 [Fistulina hepatica ATCC 64428]
MAPLTTFPLPLPPNAPPAGYDWEERDVSVSSTTTAFDTGIDQRDRFFGERCCVICGAGGRPTQWSDLKNRGWIPSDAKNHPQHEPRNGLLMCANHHVMFDAYKFFIRFFPDTRKFVFVNYSGEPSLQQFHAKAIALDSRDRYTPFPALFIIHEMRVRGFHPFRPVAPEIPADGSLWQDWILLDGVFNNVSGSFNRDSPPCSGNNSVFAQPQPQFQAATTSAGGASSGVRKLPPLTEDVIADILAATRAMPSWKACEEEGMARHRGENTQK